MPEKEDVRKSQKENRPEEEKLKREERQPVAEGSICVMCGRGKLMWVLLMIVIILILLAFLR